jgi:hypothetical protein
MAAKTKAKSKTGGKLPPWLQPEAQLGQPGGDMLPMPPGPLPPMQGPKTKGKAPAGGKPKAKGKAGSGKAKVKGK